MVDWSEKTKTAEAAKSSSSKSANGKTSEPKVVQKLALVKKEPVKEEEDTDWGSPNGSPQHAVQLPPLSTQLEGVGGVGDGGGLYIIFFFFFFVCVVSVVF